VTYRSVNGTLLPAPGLALTGAGAARGMTLASAAKIGMTGRIQDFIATTFRTSIRTRPVSVAPGPKIREIVRK